MSGLKRADRGSELIETLGLEPHPEGGHFRETFRAPTTVEPEDGRGSRSALTVIYFLLRRGEESRPHRVASDEVWHFCEGGPLELTWGDEDPGDTRVILGPVAGETRPVAVVPAGTWQAARPLGDYTLVSCTVGPGFDFADFEME